MKSTSRQECDIFASWMRKGLSITNQRIFFFNPMKHLFSDACMRQQAEMSLGN